MRAIPGGHRVNTVDQYALAAQFTNDISTIHPTNSPMWAIYQEAIQRECTALGMEEISIELEEGDVLIWHPLLPHGGGKTLDEGATRHSLVHHVVPEGVPVYQMEVFFDRNRKDVSDIATWQCELFEDRLFVAR